jgi:putative hydrolase of the HAD superfamily
MTVSPYALVLDADNTLWDTNSVFREAADRMIEVLDGLADRPNEAGAPKRGPGHESRTDARKGGLSKETPLNRNKDRPHGDHLRSGGFAINKDLLFYLSKHLPSVESGSSGLVQLARAAALYRFAPRRTPDAPSPGGEAETNPTHASREARARWAAAQAQSGQQPPGLTPSQVEEAAAAFRSCLDAAPSLLSGARPLLDGIREWRGTRPGRRTSVLFSEGDPDRLSVAFDAHRVGEGRYFDDIVLQKKTPGAFQEVCRSIRTEVSRSTLPADGIVVVGDSLERDIQPANAAGCTTVYCPGGLWGRETPEESGDRPDYTVETVDEVMGLFGLQENTEP